jgi:ATP-dependent DNA helicase RecQ
LRTEWAREAKVPAYCIFPNTVLEELARARPRTPQSLAAIKGLGPAKIERYGRALLDAITQDTAPGAAPERPAPEPECPVPPEAVRPTPPAPAPSPAPSGSAGYVSTEEWTWRLLDRGFTLDEAAAIRGLDQSAVIRHATWMARQGRPVDPRSFLPDEAAARWAEWRLEHGEAPPPSELGAPPSLWGLFLACTRDQGSLG